MPALGERFRAAREARGLTLSDVAEQIRIRSVYLAAIEEEQWSSIGAAVYVRGFLRTYARFLGLDGEEAVGQYNAAVPQPADGDEDVPAAQAVRRGAGSLGPILWIASVVAVALIAYVVFNALTYGRGRVPVAVATATPAALAAASAVSATPALSPSPAATNTMAIHLSAPSWLRVVVDGTVSVEGTFPAGTSKTFHGKSALVRVGNAGGVHVEVNGRPVGPLGKSGDVVERTFVL